MLTRTCSTPRPVKALSGKEITQASCSVTHFAAVTSKGKLYTWGEGKHGGLGHNDLKYHLKAKKVKALKDHKVKMVACGGTNHYNFVSCHLLQIEYSPPSIHSFIL